MCVYNLYVLIVNVFCLFNAIYIIKWNNHSIVMYEYINFTPCQTNYISYIWRVVAIRRLVCGGCSANIRMLSGRVCGLSYMYCVSVAYRAPAGNTWTPVMIIAVPCGHLLHGAWNIHSPQVYQVRFFSLFTQTPPPITIG